MKYSLEAIANKANTIFSGDCKEWEMEQSIPEVKNLIRELEKLLIETRELLCREEIESETEIYCFKVVKPQILGRILFLRDVVHIKSQEMCGMVEFNKEVLNLKNKEIEEFIESHKQFMRYMRAEETKFDRQYFTRDYSDSDSKYNTYYCGSLTNFSTEFDVECAQLIRFDMLGKFVSYRTYMLDMAEELAFSPNSLASNLTWSKNETDIVELAYGLYTVGAFYRGNADLISIIRLFEQCFNVKINDCYKTYRYCRNRKKERVPFLKSMIKSLLEKMDEDDM